MGLGEGSTEADESQPSSRPPSCELAALAFLLGPETAFYFGKVLE